MNESAFAEEPASTDQDLLDATLSGPDPRLIGLEALPAGKPTEDVGGGLRLDEGLGDVLAHVLGF